MVTKDTLAAAKLKAGHSTVTLLKLGDIGANFLHHTHELMTEHIALLHAYNTIHLIRAVPELAFHNALRVMLEKGFKHSEPRWTYGDRSPGMAFRYKCRSDPQMAVEVILKSTSLCKRIQC